MMSSRIDDLKDRIYRMVRDETVTLKDTEEGLNDLVKYCQYLLEQLHLDVTPVREVLEDTDPYDPGS